MNAREEINHLVKSAAVPAKPAVPAATVGKPNQNALVQRTYFSESDPELDEYLNNVRARNEASKKKLGSERRRKETDLINRRQMPTTTAKPAQQATPESQGRYSNGKMMPGGKNFDFLREAITLLKQHGVSSGGASGKYTAGSLGSNMREQFRRVQNGELSVDQQRALLEEWRRKLDKARPMKSTLMMQRANDPSYNTAQRRAQMVASYLPNMRPARTNPPINVATNYPRPRKYIRFR